MGALAKEYGKWSGGTHKVYETGKSWIWQMIFNTFALDADNEWIMIDSAIIRAHQHSAGTLKYRKCDVRTSARKVESRL